MVAPDIAAIRFSVQGADGQITQKCLSRCHWQGGCRSGGTPEGCGGKSEAEKGDDAFGVEVKNTLGYLGIEEFVTKVRMSLHLGIKPVFAVRSMPRTWADALIQAGGYAMIMGHQFYPWAHAELAAEIREKLNLPVDTPKKIEAGTMQRFSNWVAHPKVDRPNTFKIDRLLAKFQEGQEARRAGHPV